MATPALTTDASIISFVAGDKVWYAGDITRAGTNSEFHLVDARIAEHVPKTVAVHEAAALPLTGFEMLFERLRVHEPVPGATRHACHPDHRRCRLHYYSDAACTDRPGHHRHVPKLKRGSSRWAHITSLITANRYRHR